MTGAVGPNPTASAHEAKALQAICGAFVVSG